MADRRIVPFRKDKFESAREALALAFFDDPLIEFMAPDVKNRKNISEWMFGSMLKYGVRWGIVDTDETGKCAAIWLPPGGTSMPMHRIMRTPMVQFPFRLGLRGMLRFGSAMGATDKAHKRLMPGPHWYLAIVGVHPDLQGAGIGSALMNHGHERADKGQHPVYLETATDKDIAFYSKRGYEQKESLMIKDLKATLMIRPGQG